MYALLAEEAKRAGYCKREPVIGPLIPFSSDCTVEEIKVWARQQDGNNLAAPLREMAARMAAVPSQVKLVRCKSKKSKSKTRRWCY